MHLRLNASFTQFLIASLTKTVLEEIFLTSSKLECISGEYEDDHSHAQIYWYTVLLSGQYKSLQVCIK